MLFNEEVHGKAVHVVGEPPVVHRVSGAGEYDMQASTFCGRRMWLYQLGETTDDVDCMACIAAECR